MSAKIDYTAKWLCFPFGESYERAIFKFRSNGRQSGSNASSDIRSRDEIPRKPGRGPKTFHEFAWIWWGR